jgi:hypothetical protein
MGGVSAPPRASPSLSALVEAAAAVGQLEAEAPLSQGPLLVDAGSWTFWSRGAAAAETLVEASIPDGRPAPVGRRVAALLAAQERSLVRPERAPRPDPAHSEMLFVELMRHGSFERAWGLLAPECQRRWGTPQAFAAGQGPGEGAAEVCGVAVHGVRLLRDWTDPDSGHRHDEVAELVVEYTVRSGAQTLRLPRTVHLVAEHGRWRSLCYPPSEAAGVPG